MGEAYASGHGVPEKSYGAAAMWFRKAAEQGNADAQRNLSEACRKGQGVPKDLDEAERWRRKAEEARPDK